MDSYGIQSVENLVLYGMSETQKGGVQISMKKQRRQNESLYLHNSTDRVNREQVRKDSKLVRLYTVDEIARLTGISKFTWYTWISKRTVPYLKIGKLVRFDERIWEWIKSHEIEPRRNLGTL